MTDFSSLLDLFLQCALKSTLILSASALLSATLFRRASASTRHLLWSTALLAILLLPFLSTQLPAWNIFPRWTSPSPAAPAPQVAFVSPPPSTSETATPGTINPTPSSPGTTANSIPLPSSVAVKPLPPLSPAPTPAHALSLPSLLLALWAAGAILCSLPIFLAPLFIHRLRRRSTPITDQIWLDLLNSLRRHFQILRNVSLLRTSTNVPTSFGIFFPTILLPRKALGTPASEETPDDLSDSIWSRRRIVLLHELAHIKRLDHLTLLFAQLACALYWFHPLAWLAARRLHLERERACDDLVLSAGIEPPAYARTLLRIVQSFTHPTPPYAAGLLMAHPSTVEFRLRSILAPTQNRRRISILAAVSFVLLSLGALIPLSMLRAQPSTGVSQLRGIATRLSGDSISARNAAQKDLDAFPQDQLEVLRGFTQSQSDPDLKARLQHRLDEMDAFVMLRPSPLSLTVQNAPLNEVIQKLNNQLGSQLILTEDQYNDAFLRTSGQSPKPVIPPNATFSLNTSNRPFWDIVSQLIDQHPFRLVSTIRGRQMHFEDPARSQNPKSSAWDYHATEGFALLAQTSNTPAFFRATIPSPSLAAQQARGNLLEVDWTAQQPDPSLCQVRIILFPDPRIKVLQVAPFMKVTEMLDEHGQNLLPDIMPTDDAFQPPADMFTLAAQNRSVSTLIKMPLSHGKTIASLKGTLHLALVAAEFNTDIDDIDTNPKQEIPVTGAVLSLEKLPTDNLDELQLHGRITRPPGPHAPPSALQMVYVQMIDRAGRNMDTFGGINDFRINFHNGFRDGVKLRISQPLKSVDVRIPFQLKNIPLP